MLVTTWRHEQVVSVFAFGQIINTSYFFAIRPTQWANVDKKQNHSGCCTIRVCVRVSTCTSPHVQQIRHVCQSTLMSVHVFMHTRVRLFDWSSVRLTTSSVTDGEREREFIFMWVWVCVCVWVCACARAGWMIIRQPLYKCPGLHLAVQAHFVPTAVF